MILADLQQILNDVVEFWAVLNLRHQFKPNDRRGDERGHWVNPYK
jgi:hypothetical protein